MHSIRISSIKPKQQLVEIPKHEIDLEDEGENEYIEFVLPKGEYAKLTKFVKKWKGK